MSFKPIPVRLYINNAEVKQAFMSVLQGLFAKGLRGVFATDNLIAIGRNTGFASDPEFRAVFDQQAEDATDLSVIWRSHVLVWAAKSAMGVAGDFVECGTYRGFSARVLFECAKLKGSDRQLYLYDLFDPQGEVGEGHRLNAHSPELAHRVKARFDDAPNVHVIVGKVPESLALASPTKIAFMHIDMNNPLAERGALEVLWERVSDGGIVIFDDYGWVAYESQKHTIDEFLALRNHSAVELPTGQAMVIRRTSIEGKSN